MTKGRITAASTAVMIGVGVLVVQALQPAPSVGPGRWLNPPIVAAAPVRAFAVPARLTRRPPAKAVLPHDRVPPAPPTAFEIKGPAFDIRATVCQMAYVRPLDPPGDPVHTVCWVKSGFGVAPGNRSAGTSYILGHSWSQQQLVFNPLSELATKQIDERHPQLQNGVATYQVRGLDGYRVTLRTRNGTLTYVVRRSFGVRKAQAANVVSLMANIPGRVVLITCAVGGGADLDYNIVVYGYLVSAVAAQRAS